MRALCSICFNLFDGAVDIAACPCGHTFHKECLMRWMERSSSCPSCRTHIKKDQIIKHLFFDIPENDNEEEKGDVDRMLNKISNLTVQLSKKDKQKQELAESRDRLLTKFADSEAARELLLTKLSMKKKTKHDMKRELKLLRRENAAFTKEINKFRATQRKLQELQNFETILKDCESNIQEVVDMYSKGGESSLKQLASLLIVLKKEYNEVLSENTVLQGKVSQLKLSFQHYHNEAQKCSQTMINLRTDFAKTCCNLGQMELDKNSHGSIAFRQSLNEHSPNIAYTPSTSLDQSMNGSVEHEENTNNCMSPDLSYVYRKHLKRKCLSELDGPKVSQARKKLHN